MKKPVGDRLAQGLHAFAYNGTEIASGPVFTGCTVRQNRNSASLTLTFDATLLRGESVGFDPQNTVKKEDTALYLLINGSVTTGPSSSFAAAMEANHHRPEGSGTYRGPYSDGNEMGVTGWVAVSAKKGLSSNTLVVDLSHLSPNQTAQIRAVRYATGTGGYNTTTGATDDHTLGGSRICCGPHVDTALEPCGPHLCPIKASGRGNLPAFPFFAAVDMEAGKCSCFAPQKCDA